MEGLLALVAVAAVITPIVVIASLYSRVARLERELRQLTGSIPAIVRSLFDEKPAGSASPLSAAMKMRVAAAPDVLRATGAAPPAPAPVPPPSPRVEPPPVPSRTKEEWEALIGGKLLNRIGALALIIGVGFFLKYAFDRNWINETARVLIGAGTGGVLLFGATRTYARGLAIFAQGLLGAGIAILYLSVYASFNFYHLLPQIAAFGLMTCVTILAFVIAFRYDSLAVALMAWAGGFLTPFLLSTGEPNEMGLFTYVALLDAGILVISLRKTAWTILEPLALAGTWLIYLLWYSAQYASDAFSLTLYFVITFWALFHVLSTGKALRGERAFDILRLLTATAGGVFAYTALYALLEPDFHAWSGGATLCMGLVYAGSALTLRAKNPAAERWIVLEGTGAAILVITATAVQCTGYTTVGFWSVEALVLAWLGARHEKMHFSLLAFLLFIVASFKLLVTDGAIIPPADDHALLFFNQRGLTYAVLAAAAWVSSGMFHHVKGSGGTLLRGTVSAGASILAFILLTVETAALFSRLIHDAPAGAYEALTYDRWLALAVVWSAYGALSAWIGIGRGERPAYTAGLVSLLIGVAAGGLAGVTFSPITEFTFLLNWRCAALLAITLTGMTLAWRMNARGTDVPWREEIYPVMRMALMLLLLVLVTAETKDYFGRDIARLYEQQYQDGTAEEITRMENLRQLALSGVWLAFSIVLMVIGILRHSRAFRIASIVLFGGTILKIFIYDLSFLDALYRIFSFLGLGVILLGVSYAYQRYKDLIFAAEPQKGDTPPGG
jgi:uncharacterized membrane protein